MDKKTAMTLKPGDMICEYRRGGLYSAPSIGQRAVVVEVLEHSKCIRLNRKLYLSSYGSHDVVAWSSLMPLEEAKTRLAAELEERAKEAEAKEAERKAHKAKIAPVIDQVQAIIAEASSGGLSVIFRNLTDRVATYSMDLSPDELKVVVELVVGMRKQ